MERKKQAFTLVELIVVITILAILGTIAFISLQGYSLSARDSKRISDINNIKTSLNLFLLKSGKYPFPDNAQDVTYSGSVIVWQQGTIGNNVISQLSKNLPNKPTDPLVGTEYVYSVLENRTEYEIMSIYEGDSLSLNSPILNGVHSAQFNGTVRIDGTYNGLFVKKSLYIISTPSIITSEELPLIFDVTTIKSQVINGGQNNPKVGSFDSSTGALNFPTFEVYNGSINKDSSYSDKLGAYQAIYNTYTGSNLVDNNRITTLLTQTTDNEKIALLEILVLGSTKVTVNTNLGNSCDNSTKPSDNLNKVYTVNPTSFSQAYAQDSIECGYSCTGGYSGVNCDTAPDPYASCTGANTPTIGDSSILAVTTYGSCNSVDILICSGAGVGYTISSCNVGTNTSGTGAGSYGEYFQWGNNAGLISAGTSASQVTSTATGSTYSNSVFITNITNWNTSDNDNFWGEVPGNDIDRIGPCLTGYHVPSSAEWIGIHAVGVWSTQAEAVNILKLPLAGYLFTDSIPWGATGAGYYWSSSPAATIHKSSAFTLVGMIQPSGALGRSIGAPVRCIKN